MRSKTVAAILVALSTLVAVPAFAHEGKDGNAKFPIPAAEYQQKVNQREAKARAKMEERASKLDAEKAKELRAKFDAGEATINAAVAKATADGTVTKEEAKEVRKTVKSVRPHHGKHGGKKGEGRGQGRGQKK